jgi:hypothetical protein
MRWAEILKIAASLKRFVTILKPMNYLVETMVHNIPLE